jgi:hypothetical protein
MVIRTDANIVSHLRVASAQDGTLTIATSNESTF